MPLPSVSQFFDGMNRDYTATIERCFPRYREMLCGLVDYLPRDQPVGSILEIGCGTGNLSVMVAHSFPDAELHVLDISHESLEICRARLENRRRTYFYRQDIREANFKGAAFDLVVSSIAIHHLNSDEKQSLFRACFEWLAEPGVLAYADQFRGSTPALYARHIENWKQSSLAAGSTEQEFAMWMDHQREHDHHDTLVDQLAWLAQAGFVSADCVWRHLLWTSVIAEKCPNSH